MEVFWSKGNPPMETNMSKKICYCFNYTDEDIVRDVKTNGKSLIMEQIAGEKRDGGCHCSETNPKGRWCMADVRQVVEMTLNRM